MNNFQILAATCQKELGTCCSDAGLVAIINIIRKVVNIFQIIVPILLIVSLIYGLIRITINPDLKNGKQMVKNRIKAAIFVFIVPVFVDYTMGIVAPASTKSIAACWNEAQNLTEQKNTGDSIYIFESSNNKQYIMNSDVAKEKSLYKVTIDESPSTENNTQENQEVSTTQADTNTYSSSNYSTDNSNNVTAGEGSVKGQEIVNYALQFVGKQYKYGGQWNGELPYTPTDCSGFVQGVYKHFGISLERSTSQQWADKGSYTIVSPDNIQAGDLVMYDGHVGILTGNGNQLVHAATTKQGIKLSNDYRFSPVKGIMRIKGVN